MGVGKYFAGDMLNGCSLIDYTALSVEFADDVNTKLKNMTTVMIQEEIMMPVICRGLLLMVIWMMY